MRDPRQTPAHGPDLDPPSAVELRRAMGAAGRAVPPRPGAGEAAWAQGTTPEGAEWLLPWSDDEPLCFHTLTTLSAGRWGRQELEDLTARGAEISPANKRRVAWGASADRGAMRDEDRRAGDDGLVFFSVAAPYEGKVVPTQPTVAYRLRALLRCGRVGWRPHDLLGSYRRIGGAAAVRAFARDHTVWEPASVASILAIEAERLRLGAGGVAGACARLSALLGRDHHAGCARPRPCFCEAFRRSPTGYADPPDAWPENLTIPGQSEVVVAGSVPLRAASWIWDGVGPWRAGLGR